MKKTYKYLAGIAGILFLSGLSYISGPKSENGLMDTFSSKDSTYFDKDTNSDGYIGASGDADADGYTDAGGDANADGYTGASGNANADGYTGASGDANADGYTGAGEAVSAGSGDKVAYLTFDDGPSPNTEKIIDILKEKGACATFFLIGNQITDEEVPVLKKLISNGNEIGIHTYSHDEKIYGSKEAYLEDFCMGRDAIREKLGIEPKFYRFPWGSTSRYVKPIKKEVTNRLAQCGYQYVDWNVSAEDSIGTPGVDSIIANVRKDFGRFDEPVILMHDSQINDATVSALPQIIDMIRKEGYSFGVISERSEPFQY